MVGGPGLGDADVPPTGSIIAFAGTTPPAGYLVCDGSAVSRTTYAALYGVIGTTWGVGSDSTTFNLPRLLNRSPLGAGAEVWDAPRAVGSIGGTPTHAITLAELPAHSHTVPVTFRTASVTGNSAIGAELGDVSAGASAGLTGGSAGSGLAVDLHHPFAVVQYIVKT
jgi:microcystin-dependent protein